MNTISDNHKELILTTVKEVYPKYLKEKVLKRLEEKGLVSSETNLFTASEVSVDLSSSDDEEKKLIDEGLFPKIKKAIDENEKCIHVIEDMEYELSYKYATLFELSQPLGDNLEELIRNGTIIDSSSNSFSEDHCSNFTSLDNMIPTYKKISKDIDVLKFCHSVTGFLPYNGEKRTIKYPILLLFHKDLNTLEIRLDLIKGYLKNGDEYFYTREIKKVIDWIEKFFLVELIPLNLSPVIDYASRKDSTEVNVTAQAMNLKTGSKAVLDTGVNDEYVLPLLGELKNLMKENEELFKSNKETVEILEKLESFIFETEETSDLPWILLSWAHETKSKIVKVKFSFNYKGQDYDLLQYYGNNAEMERMNYVTKYIIENKREYESSEVE